MRSVVSLSPLLRTQRVSVSHGTAPRRPLETEMSGPFARARSWAALLAVLALPGASAPAPPPVDAAPHAGRHAGIQVRRGGPDAQVKFRTTRPGEAFLDLSVAARRVSWAEPGRESA